MDFHEGFEYKGFTFGWKNKVLYRLPIKTDNGREYPLKKIPKIKIYPKAKGVVKGYRIARDKKTVKQVREMTVDIDVTVKTKECKECA